MAKKPSKKRVMQELNEQLDQSEIDYQIYLDLLKEEKFYKQRLKSLGDPDG